MFAFGSNMDCQLGLGDTEERSSPIEVAGVSAGEDGVRMLAAGCQHSAVLTGGKATYAAAVVWVCPTGPPPALSMQRQNIQNVHFTMSFQWMAASSCGAATQTAN